MLTAGASAWIERFDVATKVIFVIISIIFLIYGISLRRAELKLKKKQTEETQLRIEQLIKSNLDKRKN